MKRWENKAREREELRAALELERVPAAVDQKLRQLYAELPDELPARRRGPWRAVKRGGFATAGAAAALALLLGVNAAFPAFAEGLPFVGRFFQEVNGRDGFSESLAMGKVTQGANLGGYEVQNVNVSANSDGCGLTVEKAYSDGEFLTAFLRLDVPLGVEDEAEYLLPERFSAQIEGQEGSRVSGDPYTDGNGVFFVPAGDNSYTGAATFALPESAAGKDFLSVELSLENLGGKRYGESDYADNTLWLGGRFQLAFTVPVSTAHNVEFDTLAQDNGMEVSHVRATPISVQITVTEPWWGMNRGADIVLLTQDGTEIPFNGPLSQRKGYGWTYAEQGSADGPEGYGFTGAACFDGVPAGTQRLILRVYEDDEETAVLAEFTIDLAARAAQASQTWAENGDLAIGGPFHYQYLDGYAGEYSGEKAENGLFVQRLIYDSRERFYSLSVRTEAGYRALDAQLVNAVGETVAQGASEYRETRAIYRSGFDEAADGEPGDYTIAILNALYQPAYGETFTVRLTDRESGEVLAEQAITLSEREN